MNMTKLSRVNDCRYEPLIVNSFKRWNVNADGCDDVSICYTRCTNFMHAQMVNFVDFNGRPGCREMICRSDPILSKLSLL